MGNYWDAQQQPAERAAFRSRWDPQGIFDKAHAAYLQEIQRLHSERLSASLSVEVWRIAAIAGWMAFAAVEVFRWL